MLLVPSNESFSGMVVFRFPSSDPPPTRIRKRTPSIYSESHQSNVRNLSGKHFALDEPDSILLHKARHHFQGHPPSAAGEMIAALLPANLQLTFSCNPQVPREGVKTGPQGPANDFSN
jgi:hypothetical protein